MTSNEELKAAARNKRFNVFDYVQFLRRRKNGALFLLLGFRWGGPLRFVSEEIRDERMYAYGSFCTTPSGWVAFHGHLHCMCRPSRLCIMC